MNILAGFLVGLAVFLGLVILLVLGLSITFGSGGFGGDRTFTAAERASEAQAQFAGLVGLVLAGAAIPLFVRLRARPDLRALILGGLALAEVLGLALLLSGSG